MTTTAQPLEGTGERTGKTRQGWYTECLVRLRQKALAGERPFVPAGWRGLAYLRVWAEHPGGREPLNRARGLAAALDTCPLSVDPDDLLPGYHLRGAGPEVGIVSALDWAWNAPREIDVLREQLDASGLPDAAREDYLELAGKVWAHRIGPEPVATAVPWGDEERAGVYFGNGWSENHSVRDYPKLLRIGLRGVLDEIQESCNGLASADPDYASRYESLEAMRLCVEAGIHLAERYAKAYAAAAGSAPPEQRKRFLAIAEACRQAPAGPARTFRQAVQSLWIAHTITCVEDNINANSIGRIDRMLHPFYEADLAAGRITRDEAAELLAALWIKLYLDYDVQQASIGGLTPDGKDATNELTCLCLEITDALDFIRCLSVRVHSETPVELLEQALRIVAKGGGVPFFFNDEAVIPALREKGVPVEEARDYAVIGCVEITIPGKAFPHAVSHQFNLAKCLELAIHDGVDPATGRRLGPSTNGGLIAWKTFDDAYAAFWHTVEYFVRHAVARSNHGDWMQERYGGLPWFSALTEDCIRTGRDAVAGGARYHFHSCSAIGIPNCGDSLAVLRELVFERGDVSGADVAAALMTDFEGRDDLRNKLLRSTPKYGNDRAEVDELVARISTDYCRLMHNMRTRHGGRFHVHLFSFLWNVDPFGKRTGALPDGRRAGEPLAYSLSPMQGRDESGLTAVLKSLAGLPHDHAAGGSSAIIEVDPTLFESANLPQLTEVVRTAFQLGVGQLQLNVVDAETLRCAQECPDKYRNLAVRVSGFSQKFVLLNRDLQDHIIARTKHNR